MTPRRALLTVAGVLAGTFLVFFFTILFIPSRQIEEIIVRQFAREGYTFQAAGFRKSFPLGFTAKRVTIGSARGALLRLDRARAGISLLPLLVGRIGITFDGKIGSGELSGSYSPQGGGKGSLLARGVRLEDIPFFRTVADADVKGMLRAEASFKGSGAATTGEFRLEAKGVDLRGLKIGETPLPDAAYDTVQGMVRFGGGKGTLDSFTLQGEGLYIRLKGDMPLATPLETAPLNLTLELMPKPEFLDRQKAVFLLLAKYLVTPGHYQLPIRGTLGKPALQ